MQRRASQPQRPGAHGTPFRTQLQWCVLQSPFSHPQRTLSGASGESSGLYARRAMLPRGVAAPGLRRPSCGVKGAVRAPGLVGDARRRGVVLGVRRVGVLFFFGVRVLLPIRSFVVECFCECFVFS